MAAKRPARASLRDAKAPLSPRYRRKLHHARGHCCGGSIGWSRDYAQAGFNIAATENLSVGFELGVGQTRYSFGSGFTVLGDTDINEASFSIPIQVVLDNGARVLAVPQVSYAGESGADTGDSLTYGILTGIAWQVSPTLTIGPAFGVQSSLNDGTVAFPFLLIDWKLTDRLTDRLTFSTGSGFAASRGPGLRLAYQVSDSWQVGIEARYEEFEFRLAEDNSVPGGVGIDQSVPLVVTSSWSPTEHFTLSGFAGVALGGEFSVENNSGAEIYSSDYDTTPIFGALVRYTF